MGTQSLLSLTQDHPQSRSSARRLLRPTSASLVSCDLCVSLGSITIMGRKAKNCKEAPSTRPSSAPRVYSAEQMVRALVSLGNEALLLPDSLHVPL